MLNPKIHKRSTVSPFATETKNQVVLAREGNKKGYVLKIASYSQKASKEREDNQMMLDTKSEQK